MFELKNTRLRLVSENDAGFILSLRLDEGKNKYLSATNQSLESQVEWLRNYKKREEAAEEYYFIIERLDTNQSVGTVRLYDFRFDISSFCWGSWILNDKKTRFSALESALLIYEFGFIEKDFMNSHFDVRLENEKVISFHKKMGAQEVSHDGLDMFFTYSKSAYLERKQKLLRFLVK